MNNQQQSPLQAPPASQLQQLQQQQQQQLPTPSGGSNAHPRNNFNNNNGGNRHHYNNNTGNKPYRKNYNKDGQYQQVPVQYSPYYQQVLYGGYPQQQYYYGVPMQPYDQYLVNTGYYQAASPAGSAPPSAQGYPHDLQSQPQTPHLQQQHKAILTDKSGNKIQIKKPTHSRLPSTASSIATPSSASATPVAAPAELPSTPAQPTKPSTPVAAAAAAAAAAPAASSAKAISDLEKKARNDEFKAKIAARAAALLKLKEEKAKETSAPKLELTETKKEEAEVVTKAPVEEQKEEPKVEAKVPETVKEEPKVEEKIPEPVKEEPKVEETIPEPIKEEPKEVETTPTVAPVAEPSQESEENVTTPVSETIPEEKVPSFTISNLFNLLRFARPVNPYTHKYPSTVTTPDAKLGGGKKIRYDPLFLIQFQQPLNLARDEEWDSKYGAKIVIPDASSANKGNARSFSRNSSSQFGKGFIGNGPVQMRSQTNLRNDFNSRSGSRQGSKRRNPKEKSSRNKQNSRRDRAQDDDKSSEPAEPVAPLVKSESRWVPRSRVKAQEEVKTAPDGTVLLNEEDINRKVKSHLNKLTLELFDVISAEIIAIANQSKWEEDGKTLKTVIELTFAKACDEPHWSSVYAKLCTKLFTDISPEVKDTTIPDASTGGPTTGRVLVRKYLLTRCQIEYEKGWTDKLPTNEDGTPIEPEMMSDEYYKLAAAKRRGLGLVRFIGELYSLSLLSEKIIVQCISGLVSNIEDPSEDVLENLVQLLNTVGPLIDASRNQNFIEFMNSVFERINKIIETVKMSSRIKFKLMDLIDLRNKKWKGKEGDKGPKTLTEIHSEAERKRLEEERSQNERRQNSRRGGDSRSNSSRGGNSSQNLASQWGSSSNRVSQNEIKSVGTIRNSDRFGPMNNFKESKSLRGNNNDNMRTASSSSLRSQLQQQQQQQLQQQLQQQQQQQQVPSSPASQASTGSGLNTRENSKREPSNMFAALEDHDDEASASEEELEETPVLLPVDTAAAVTEGEAEPAKQEE